jgi:uncharacterized protein (UPF0335 family)
MSTNTRNAALRNFIDRYKAIESEIKMLQEDKKALLDDLKDNQGIEPKVIRKAIQVAKIRTGMADNIMQLDEIVDQIEGSIV